MKEMKEDEGTFTALTFFTSFTVSALAA